VVSARIGGVTTSDFGHRAVASAGVRAFATGPRYQGGVAVASVGARATANVPKHAGAVVSPELRVGIRLTAAVSAEQGLRREPTGGSLRVPPLVAQVAVNTGSAFVGPAVYVVTGNQFAAGAATGLAVTGAQLLCKRLDSA
jgi:hypothetical protein